MNFDRNLDIIRLLDEEYSDVYHLTVIRDQNEFTLIDTGIIGQFEDLKTQLNLRGISLKDIQRVFITHADIDHIGNIFPLIENNPAMEIWSHKEEAACLNGEMPFEKMNAETPPLQKAYFKKFSDKESKVKVTRELKDGEILPLIGGIEVIHTPGHTKGHVCFYIKEQKLLIAGDELGCVNGRLVGPSPEYTPNMSLAIESLKKLLPREIDKVLCYHGGIFEGNVKESIARIIEEQS